MSTFETVPLEIREMIYEVLFARTMRLTATLEDDNAAVRNMLETSTQIRGEVVALRDGPRKEKWTSFKVMRLTLKRMERQAVQGTLSRHPLLNNIEHLDVNMKATSILEWKALAEGVKSDADPETMEILRRVRGIAASLPALQDIRVDNAISGNEVGIDFLREYQRWFLGSLSLQVITLRSSVFGRSPLAINNDVAAAVDTSVHGFTCITAVDIIGQSKTVTLTRI